MRYKFGFAAMAATLMIVPAIAEDGEAYQAELPDLSACIEQAGADGHATQSELDACISANMEELEAALPQVETPPSSKTPWTVKDSNPSGSSAGETDKES